LKKGDTLSPKFVFKKIMEALLERFTLGKDFRRRYTFGDGYDERELTKYIHRARYFTDDPKHIAWVEIAHEDYLMGTSR
jgi:hypothetical protein